MTIDKLKNQGHELLEEYKRLLPYNGKKIHDIAYKDLQDKMSGRNPHFGQMKTKAEVMLAIGSLKRMIASRHSH